MSKVVNVKGATSEQNVDTAFKQAKAIYLANTIAQVIVFLASGVAVFLSTMMGYWGITIVSAFICGLAVLQLLKI